MISNTEPNLKKITASQHLFFTQKKRRKFSRSSHIFVISEFYFLLFFGVCMLHTIYTLSLSKYVPFYTIL